MSKAKLIIQILLLSVFFSCEKPDEEEHRNDTQADKPTTEKPDSTSTTPPDDVESNELNLLDYSYAGYKYSETGPPEWNTLGYEVYDVTDFGAVADDGRSDREAFIAAVDAALGYAGYKIDGNGWIVFNHKERADAIVYFPEGEFILHTAADDVEGVSRSIQIRAGNFIIRGAGRDKTTIVMQDPNMPRNPSQLYSSPEMIQIKHNSSHASFESKIKIMGNAEKGSKTITVNNASMLSPQQWVCLYVSSKNRVFVSEQLHPYDADPSWEIATAGVQVIDYHRIKSIDGNKITFYEPLMTEVKGVYGWELHTFPHYENVGIEDLTFKGNAKKGFAHHGSWEDDGGYKPISIQRVTDSWIRNVGFVSTSEACSIINSANVSAYDITMAGNKGHSAIRSQASSRVLIACTRDESEDGGHFHGVGVSKQSIGTVLWRNRWGDDSCFESHASQPRATLIDCCEGGWHRKHSGGDRNQIPHHLSDLVIWNFTPTRISESHYLWWGDTNHSFLPPVIAGFNGAVTFDKDQTFIIDDIKGVESLFEHQLKERTGNIPEWLLELKNN